MFTCLTVKFLFILVNAGKFFGRYVLINISLLTEPITCSVNDFPVLFFICSFSDSRQLIDRIEYVRDPVLYDEKMKVQQEERERVLRIRKLERELANELKAERLKVEEAYQLERRRLQELGWRALISEHESTTPDNSTNSGRLYHLRDHLLSPPAPGEKIGQPKNAETRNWRNEYD